MTSSQNGGPFHHNKERNTLGHSPSLLRLMVACAVIHEGLGRQVYLVYLVGLDCLVCLVDPRVRASSDHVSVMLPPSSLAFPHQEGRPCWSKCGHRTEILPCSIDLLKEVAGLSFTARIGRALFHRARSASNKDGVVIPFSPHLPSRTAEV